MDQPDPDLDRTLRRQEASDADPEGNEACITTWQGRDP
jgi:hypothetical protein